jgi:antitoxin component YwqK of YwqJK toxin-antitoxin module
MKKLLLIITLILPLLLSSESWAIGAYDLVEREGLYYEKFTDVPFTGKIDYQSKLSFKGGKPQGEWVGYYENGQLRSKVNYVNGNLHGKKFSYYNNGQLRSKENYVNGKKHGEWFYYRHNGLLAKKENYVNGKAHGEFTAYYSNGTLAYIHKWVNDQFGEIISNGEN